MGEDSDGPDLHSLAFQSNPQPELILDSKGVVLAINSAATQLLASFSDGSLAPGFLFCNLFEVSNDDLYGKLLDGVNSGFLLVQAQRLDTRALERIRFAVLPLKRRPKIVDHFLLLHEPVSYVSAVFAKLGSEVQEATRSAAISRRETLELELRVQQLDRFAAVAAHDLKSPLRHISVLLEFLEEDFGDLLPEEGLGFLRKARAAASRQHGWIGRLLEHARTSRAKIHLEPVYLANAINEIRDRLTAVITDVEGNIELGDQLGCVSADPVLLHQLFENLLANALKYRSPDRTPVIRISRLDNPDGSLEIRVEDNGIGFDNQFQDRILEPFRRLHTGAEYEGAGLGLATCKTICDRHGWALRCHGTPDIGAVFIIGIDAVGNAAFAEV